MITELKGRKKKTPEVRKPFFKLEKCRASKEIYPSGPCIIRIRDWKTIIPVKNKTANGYSDN